MRYLLALAAILLFAIPNSAQIKPAAATVPTGPSFSAIAMDGSKVDTAALRGKVVVINLWFVNCPNCVEEINSLNQLVDQYSDNKDVVFVGLAASPKALIENFLTKHPFKYVVVPDAINIILGQFGTPDKSGGMGVPFPMHLVLNREGDVVVKTQGIKGIDAVKQELARQFKTTPSSAK